MHCAKSKVEPVEAAQAAANPPRNAPTAVVRTTPVMISGNFPKIPRSVLMGGLAACDEGGPLVITLRLVKLLFVVTRL